MIDVKPLSGEVLFATDFAPRLRTFGGFTRADAENGAPIRRPARGDQGSETVQVSASGLDAGEADVARRLAVASPTAKTGSARTAPATSG